MGMRGFMRGSGRGDSRAKTRGTVSAIGPFLDQLDELGFHLAPVTKEMILGKAGEA